MSILFIVLPLAILMAGAAVVAFIGAVRGGQFDDLDSPAVRIVVDDDTLDAPARRTDGPGDPSQGA